MRKLIHKILNFLKNLFCAKPKNVQPAAELNLHNSDETDICNSTDRMSADVPPMSESTLDKLKTLGFNENQKYVVPEDPNNVSIKNIENIALNETHPVNKNGETTAAISDSVSEDLSFSTNPERVEKKRVKSSSKRKTGVKRKYTRRKSKKTDSAE